MFSTNFTASRWWNVGPSRRSHTMREAFAVHLFASSLLASLSYYSVPCRSLCCYSMRVLILLSGLPLLRQLSFPILGALPNRQLMTTCKSCIMRRLLLFFGCTKKRLTCTFLLLFSLQTRSTWAVWPTKTANKDRSLVLVAIVVFIMVVRADVPARTSKWQVRKCGVPRTSLNASFEGVMVACILNIMKMGLSGVELYAVAFVL